MKLAWNTNLRNRIVVGVIGGPALLLCAVLGGWFFFILIVLLVVLSLYELQNMGESLGFPGRDLISYVFSIVILYDLFRYGNKHSYGIVLIYIAVILTAALVGRKENKLIEVCYRCLTTLYISLFLGSLLLLRELPFESGYITGGKLIASIFLSIWFLDTIAYFAGKIYGKHKLVPKISPKKTVEGGIGGFIGAIAALVLSKYVFFNELLFVHAIFIGILIGITGQIGDVIESFFKRQTGRKDSSLILPGHGGVLDRFDSLIFISPFVYFYVLSALPTL